MKILYALVALLVFAVSFSAQQTTGAAQPTFVASAMDGTRVDLAALRGKVVVINLWFVNCPNCVEEIERLNQLVDRYKDNKDVVFLGLAASKKPLVEQFLASHPFKYQVIPDAAIIIVGKFGTPDKTGNIEVPFPMHYVLDRQGNVIVKTQGIKGVEDVKAALANQVGAKSASGN
jgi:peroxiredoxin